MLHQTLIPSSSPSCPSVSASLSSPLLYPSNAKDTAAATTTASSSPLLCSPAMPSYAHHRSSLDERMEALKGSSRQEETAEEVAAAAEAPAAWGFGDRDGFSVEDLLDLEEFCEADKDGADEHEAAPAAADNQEKSNDDSLQSVVSYDVVVPHAPSVPEIVDLPAHDAEELEWVSRIMDDSLSELPPPPPPPTATMMASLAGRAPQHRLMMLQQRRPHDGAYRALPSSASDPLRTPTICALSTEALVPIKAKRSKRSRASGWSLSGAAPDSTSSSSTTTTSSCSSSASFSPYFLMDSAHLGASDLTEDYTLGGPPPKKYKHGKHSKHKPKKRGRKPKHLPPHPASAAVSFPSDRRCSHCGVQKTPQWRAGPEGAKTLCNACGVRYKSGRLLPEYRPACSPTFESTIHSNSHRKVLEMRRKKEDGPLTVSATAPAVASF
ncbi:GATA transcription factor 5 [Brachypodium distachyon]|uniref:GATA-type domain-containing protein n=1 Tax=Brachypodium distachyon TaxID=15368 RepID=I1J055_BRADI|nr:GATA transcription factor 5 [Brachypodium distachyon]KQJ83828.1 hypothetical protein BRADI_5g17057v3 [Brachypodium distachyon]|eukprot:XP_003581466.1 GATA transcription factor 5 [Brachypodium distachyon]